MPPVPPAASILASLGQATFAWDLASDAMAWSDNVATVFPDIPVAALASGADAVLIPKVSRAADLDRVAALVPGTLYLMIALGALRWVDRH